MDIQELRDELYKSMLVLAKLRSEGATNKEKTVLETKMRYLFENFKTPQELHYLAERIEWETNEEIELVFWICQNHLCSQASALMLFWRAQPLDFTEYTLSSKTISSSNTWIAITFEIIQYIMIRFTDASYEHFDIPYNPNTDTFRDKKSPYIALNNQKKPEKWNIPSIMKQAV